MGNIKSRLCPCCRKKAEIKLTENQNTELCNMSTDDKYKFANSKLFEIQEQLKVIETDLLD
tara:strand:- start:192 stop:374 length:183 start_codon:yes stop_codon:yes gene_type:complete